MMGIPIGGAQGAAWRAASCRMEEAELFAAVADGVDARAVDVLWANAEEMLAEQGRSLDGMSRYAGLFAGAFDTLYLGGRRRGLQLRYAAAAEADETRRAALRAAYGVRRCYGLAKEMAEGWRGGLDVVTATPSCKKVTSAQRPRTAARRRELAAEARGQLMDDISALEQLVQEADPDVVLLEETSGLRTHHRKLYDDLQARLASWEGYKWRHGQVCAAELGAAHHRRRLLWVAVKERAG